MADTAQLCEMLHGSSLIPIYLYRGGDLAGRWPDSNPLFDPAPSLIGAFFDSDKIILHLPTSIHSFYAFIRLDAPRDFVVLGPVNAVPYSSKDISRLRRELGIPSELSDAYENFLRKIPVLHEDIFVYNMLQANYVLRGEYLGIGEYYNRDFTTGKNAVHQKFTETEMELRESGYVDMSYEISERAYPMVERGDLQGLLEYSSHPPDFQIGVFSNNALRQHKTMFIIAVSQISRVAIRGGVPVQTSLAMMNAYILAMDSLERVSDVNELLLKAIVDFTQRVAEARNPGELSAVTNRAIQYIHENVNRLISCREVAEHVGLSRARLSERFSREAGTSLGNYIRNTKLDKACEILRNTSKSVGEVSNYLGFSSQSHFQKAFKKRHGTTPGKLRNQNKPGLV